MGSNARAIAQAAADYSSGGLIGMRNRIINGSGLFGQRGVIALSGAGASYGADRWLAAVSGGTGVTANTFKSTFGGSSSFSGIWIAGSFTSGIPYFAQRIEWQNTYDLNSNYVTVSGLVYQDTGSTQQFVARLSKANAADNFSGISVLQTGTAFSVPTGVVTPFKQVFQLGATDASNGLQLEIFGTSPITVTSKNFAVSDVVLEKGAINDPRFEWRHIGIELALCQRYFCVVSNGLSGICLDTTRVALAINFPTVMRAQPTVSSNANLRISDVYTNAFVQSSIGISVRDTPVLASGATYAAINFAGLTAGRVVFIESNNGVGGAILLSSEL